MKKALALLLFAFLLPISVFAREIPEKIDGMTKNDFLLNRVMLPNPNVYLYGTDSNGFPILLMNFSSTIPFYGIEDNYKIFPWLGRYIPFFLKKTSSLKFYSLYLTIEPSCGSPECKNFRYKILKLQCKEVSQNIGHIDTDKLTTHFAPKYKEADVGYMQSENERKSFYAGQFPIITYSGTGSNMLQIMLKRGKKFPIPAGHIDVSMVVIAIPSYAPPLTYDVLKGNCGCKYDFVKDFMDYVNPCCPCTHEIRNISFAKTYLDSRIKNYYGLDPKNNPDICLSSEVIMGNRINHIAEKKTTTTGKTNVTNAICPINTCIDPCSGECKDICVEPKSQTADTNTGAAPQEKIKKVLKFGTQTKSKGCSEPIICNDTNKIQLQYEQKIDSLYINQKSNTVLEEDVLYSPVMNENEFMYNKIIIDYQELNKEPVIINFDAKQ